MLWKYLLLSSPQELLIWKLRDGFRLNLRSQCSLQNKLGLNAHLTKCEKCNKEAKLLRMALWVSWCSFCFFKHGENLLANFFNFWSGKQSCPNIVYQHRVMVFFTSPLPNMKKVFYYCFILSSVIVVDWDKSRIF